MTNAYQVQLLAPVAAFGWAKQPCVADFEEDQLWEPCVREVFDAKVAEWRRHEV